MALKAGSASDVGGSMTELMESAMQEEWAALHGSQALPPSEDRMIMFAAIAKGVLRYLDQHKVEIATTAVAVGSEGPHTHTLVFQLAPKP